MNDGLVTAVVFKSTAGDDIQDKVRWKLVSEEKNLALLNPYCKPSHTYGLLARTPHGASYARVSC